MKIIWFTWGVRLVYYRMPFGPRSIQYLQSAFFSVLLFLERGLALVLPP